MARAVLVVCFNLLLDVVFQKGNQLCPRHLYILSIFSSWKVDPHLFCFLLSFWHASHHLPAYCLHSGWLNLVLDLLMLILEDHFFVSTAWNRNLVFAWFTSPFISITSYGIKADSSYIRSFDLLSWSLGFTSWSSLQTSECKITMHNAKNIEDKILTLLTLLLILLLMLKQMKLKKKYLILLA